jgi:hypothetical protein
MFGKKKISRRGTSCSNGREKILLGNSKRWTEGRENTTCVHKYANESKSILTYGHNESGAAGITSGGPLGGVGQGGYILISSAFLSVCLGCKCH